MEKMGSPRGAGILVHQLKVHSRQTIRAEQGGGKWKTEGNISVPQFLQWGCGAGLETYGTKSKRTILLPFPSTVTKTSCMNQCLQKPPKQLPLPFLPAHQFPPDRKQTMLQQKTTVTENPKELSPSLSSCDTEKVALGFVTVCCWCHFNTKQDIKCILFIIKYQKQDVLSHPSRSTPIYRNHQGLFPCSQFQKKLKYSPLRVNSNSITGLNLKYRFSYYWKVTAQSIHSMQSKGGLTPSKAANALEIYGITFKNIHLNDEHRNYVGKYT